MLKNFRFYCGYLVLIFFIAGCGVKSNQVTTTNLDKEVAAKPQNLSLIPSKKPPFQL